MGSFHANVKLKNCQFQVISNTSVKKNCQKSVRHRGGLKLPKQIVIMYLNGHFWNLWVYFIEYHSISLNFLITHQCACSLPLVFCFHSYLYQWTYVCNQTLADQLCPGPLEVYSSWLSELCELQSLQFFLIGKNDCELYEMSQLWWYLHPSWNLCDEACLQCPKI